MSDYVIFTDSTSDLPQELANELGIQIVPFSFRLDDKEYLNYLDNRELALDDFYECLKQGKTSSTSLVTSIRYMEYFEPFLQKGMDVLYMCLSTGLSGSYQQSLLAASELEEKYPGRKAIMIDSLCASLGQGLLAYYAAKEKEKGKTIDENAEYVRSLIPNLCHWFTVDDLNHLRRGGRVSGASAFVGTVLGIKPMLHVDDEGRLIPVDKVRGRAKSLEYLVKRMEATMIEPKDQIVFISHSVAPEDAKKLASMVEQRIGTKNFVINGIGPVIGSHTGLGTLTLFFLGSKR